MTNNTAQGRRRLSIIKRYTAYVLKRVTLGKQTFKTGFGFLQKEPVNDVKTGSM